MSYQEKNITVSLVSAIVILGYFLLRIIRMLQSGPLVAWEVFRLWGVIIVVTILANILGTILTHIATAIIEAIKTQQEDPQIDGFEDERDDLIKLKGIRVAHIVSSLGVFIAMIMFVLGKPALVMFTIIIFSGIFAEMLADIARLVYYRRGV
jgi:hypothetical protein